jgi:hypothetical protein
MSRTEIKYLIPDRELPELRALIEPFVQLDPHGQGREDKGYTVRSIYLDTPGLRYYQEKKAGIRVRRKLRIRGYNDLRSGDWVFLEIKRKIQNRVSKNRAPIHFEALANIFGSGDVDRYVLTNRHYPNSREDGRRFFYHIYRYGLIPTFSTVYEREAFFGRYDPTLRITLDRGLRGRAYPSLEDLGGNSFLRTVRPGHTILEVKFDTAFPRWLRSVLGRYDLRTEALSKYCLCAEISGRQWDRRIGVLGSHQMVEIK